MITCTKNKITKNLGCKQHHYFSFFFFFPEIAQHMLFLLINWLIGYISEASHSQYTVTLLDLKFPFF